MRSLQRQFIKSFNFRPRHSMQVVAAILIAIFINRYFAFSPNGWIILTTLLCMQTTRGTPVRQVFLHAMLVLGSIIFAYFCLQYLPLLVNMLLLSISYVLFMYFLLSEPLLQNKKYFFLIPLWVPFFIAMFFPISNIQNQLIDAALGAAISFACTILLFPISPQVEFQQGMIPILKDLKSYLQTIAVDLSKNQMQLFPKKNELQNALLADNNLYPEWIYETGFNPQLRSGFRFFLLSIEKSTDLLFAIVFYLQHISDAKLLKKFEADIVITMNKNVELIDNLLNYFQTQQISAMNDDFISDITALEKQGKLVLPQDLALLDLSDDYINIVALIRDIKDLRQILLQLVMALPPLSS